MAKRFSDTDKWKKSFFRGLEAPYKLLWMYILDDCDIAGVWQVDIDVACIRIGEKVSSTEALRLFGDRIIVFDQGKKWFVYDFIFFQYGELKTTNRMHQAVINILRKNNLDFPEGASKGLPSPQGQGQGIIQGQGEGQGHIGDPKNFETNFKTAFDEMTLEQFVIQFKGVDVQNELQVFRLKCNANAADYHKRDVPGLRLAFIHQLKASPATKKINGTVKQKSIDHL